MRLEAEAGGAEDDGLCARFRNQCPGLSLWRWMHLASSTFSSTMPACFPHAQKATHDIFVPPFRVPTFVVLRQLFEFFGTSPRPESYRDKEQVTFNK
jgi:hypothetical protein